MLRRREGRRLLSLSGGGSSLRVLRQFKSTRHPSTGGADAPTFRVRTEGFGPSDDLVKGAQPRDRLVVETTGLHPQDFDVQRRVLELTMPSLDGVTVQPPGEPSAPPGNDTVQAEVMREARDSANEEQMVTLANVIIEQVEARTGVQLEALRDHQEESQRNAANIIIHALRREIQRVTNTGGERQGGGATIIDTGKIVDAISSRLSKEIRAHESAIADAVVESSSSSGATHIDTSELVEAVSKRLEDYFESLESQLKRVADEVRRPKAMEGNTVAVPVEERGGGADDVSQTMEDIHTTITTVIEASAQQQLQHMSGLISDMLLSHRNAVNASPNAGSPEATANEANEVNSRIHADFRELQGCIEDALRTATDEIGNHVTTELNQLRLAGTTTTGLQTEEMENFVGKMDKILKACASTARTVASVDDAISDVVKGQTETQEAVGVIKTILEEQQKTLANLQANWRNAANSSSPSTTPSNAYSYDTLVVEQQLSAFSAQQEQLSNLLHRALESFGERDQAQEALLMASVESVQNGVRDAFAALATRNQVQAVLEAAPTTANVEAVNADGLSRVHASIQRLEEGMEKMSSMLTQHISSMEEEQTKLREGSSKDAAGAPQITPDVVKEIVVEALASHGQELLQHIRESTAPNELNAELSSVSTEQHLLSFTSSVNEAVTNGLQRVKEELALFYKEAHATPPKEDSDAAAQQSNALTVAEVATKQEELLRSLHTEVLAVVREEMSKTHDVDLTSMYKYIDSMLLLVREELSQHQKQTVAEIGKISLSLENIERALSTKLSSDDTAESKSLAAEVQQQGEQLNRILDISSSFMKELKQREAHQQPSPPSPSEDTPAPEHDSTSGDSQLYSDLLQSLKEVLSEYQKQTASSISQIQDQLATFPTKESMEAQLTSSATQITSQVKEAVSTSVAAAAPSSASPPAPKEEEKLDVEARSSAESEEKGTAENENDGKADDSTSENELKQLEIQLRKRNAVLLGIQSRLDDAATTKSKSKALSSIAALKSTIESALEADAALIQNITRSLSSNFTQWEELEKNTGLLEEVIQKLEHNEGLLKEMEATIQKKSLEADPVPQRAESATLQHQEEHTAALESLQAVVESVQDEVQKISSLHDSTKAAAIEEMAERLREIEASIASGGGGSLGSTSTGWVEKYTGEMNQAIQTALDTSAERTASAVNEVKEVMSEGNKQVLAEQLEPLQTQLEKMSQKIAALSSCATTPPSVTTEAITEQLDAMKKEIVAAVSQIREEQARAVEELAKSIAEVKKEIPLQEAPRSSGVSLNDLDDRLSNVQEKFIEEQQKRLVPLMTSWEAFERRHDATITAAQKTHDAAARLATQQHETVLEEWRRQSSSLQGTVSKGMEEMLNCQQGTVASIQSALAEAESQRKLHHTHLEKAVVNQIAGSTSQLLERIDDLAQRTPVVSSGTRSTYEAVHVPQMPERSLWKTLGMFFAQTLMLCVALIVCLYYVFAALLIAFVPKPVEADEWTSHPIMERRPKRVADRVL